MSADLIAEARRQVEVCNACRYCEGYCAVFPAINLQRAFTDGDITQLANLCHNCRGCYYACQYTDPHEFNLNLPRALAEVRVESWENLIRPSGLARLFQRHGVAVAFALVVATALLVGAIFALRPANGEGFYAYLSHTAMVALFAPAFLAPLAVVGLGLRDYWRKVGGGPIRLPHMGSALAAAARLGNLSGGQGQGCNFEVGDRFSNRRRWLHQAAMWGFLLCFASTSAATVLHYGFGISAPHSAFSLPKILGVPGGFALVVGCVGLAWLNTRADPELGATAAWGGEMAFVLLLAATGLTGLALYAASGTAAVPVLLVAHLATVLALFVLVPYSKMVHGFFRLAALVRDAQISASSTRR